MIDVGGPSMLRAAAKNFAHVAAVSRPEQYEPVLARAARARRALARDAPRARARRRSRRRAAYEAAIARWFGETSASPSS